MLTQRISAIAHDLARQCHVVGQGGGGGGNNTSYSEEKSASGKLAKDSSNHRTRRRKQQCLLSVPSIFSAHFLTTEVRCFGLY